MIPLSLYIHVPWCIRKCPYCDFNSHKSPDQLPETDYIHALIDDLDQDLATHPGQEIHSIFIGGGTPSLLSAEAYHRLFTQIKQRLRFKDNIEITLEANPGTIEHGLFADYRAIGINRLSLGIQSFNAEHLHRLGRIHDNHQAHRAIEQAQKADFTNLNIDIMHSLPGQTFAQALDDLQQALAHQPSHLSWYQLTIEPNTQFYKSQPILPHEDLSADIEEAGFALLQQHQFERYEISAFCKPNSASQHNLNYWLFGDYYGIGAGAHGKLSEKIPEHVVRTQKHRQPKDYLDPHKAYLTQSSELDPQQLIFEFMLNSTRLEQAISQQLFTQRTGLTYETIRPLLESAQERHLLTIHPDTWQITPLGRRFTNDLQAMFLP